MKIRSPLLTKLAAWLAVVLLRLLFRTLKFEFRLEHPELHPLVAMNGNPVIYCVWHDSIIVPILCFSKTRAATLVSRHQDGSYLAKALAILGYRPVRGSTSRGGAQALRQLMEAIQDRHVVITPDGPRGPRRKLKPGIVYLASQSGRPIAPGAFSAERCWRIQGSWTDLMIPRPFSKVFIVGGGAIHVPPDISREGLEDYMARAEAEMDRLDRIAEQLAAGIEPPVELRRAAA